MWSLPNIHHLHAQPLSVTEEKKKKKSSSSAGEAVSLLIAIDNVVRSNKTSISIDDRKLSDRLLESSAISVLDQILSGDDTNNNQTENETGNNLDDPWALDQLLNDNQVIKFFCK